MQNFDNSDNTANFINAIEARHERPLQQRGVVLGYMTARQERYYKEKLAKQFYWEDLYADASGNPEDTLIDMIDGTGDEESNASILKEEDPTEEIDHMSSLMEYELFLVRLMWEQEMQRRINFANSEQDSIDEFEDRFLSDRPFNEGREPLDREEQEETFQLDCEFKQAYDERRREAHSKRFCKWNGGRKRHYLDDVEHRATIRGYNWESQFAPNTQEEAQYARELYAQAEASYRELVEDFEEQQAAEAEAELIAWVQEEDETYWEAYRLASAYFLTTETAHAVIDATMMAIEALNPTDKAIHEDETQEFRLDPEDYEENILSNWELAA